MYWKTVDEAVKSQILMLNLLLRDTPDTPAVPPQKCTVQLWLMMLSKSGC